jgi:Tol biopolymer transport system component
MKYIFYIFSTLLIFSCKNKTNELEITTAVKSIDSLRFEEEVHLKNIKQLTFGGDNAEAYWSFDNKSIVFQATNDAWGAACDQIYISPIDVEMRDAPQLVSTGKGRTTCSYFMPGDSTIIYASTHAADDNCPPTPSRENGYVWPVYETFDIYVANLKGEIVQKLTDLPGYDAEPTVSPKGDKIVFTSTRSGDLELYTMNIDGSDVKQVTNELGYDGGAFFSPDGTKLIFRSSRPTTDEDVKKYKELLAKNMVMPSDMELYVCNVDGTDLKKITNLGSANWAPFFHPSGEKVIFSTNHHSDKGGRPKFNLFMMNIDGSGLEQITYDAVFDAFPMFSPDGKRIIFSSNRNNGGTHDTNLFVADWVE